MQFAIDIQSKLEMDFGSEVTLAKDEIEGLYAQTHWQIGNRAVRSIIFLAKGDLNKLMKVKAAALSDPREVVWEAEYEQGDDQLRDFSKTFTELGFL